MAVDTRKARSGDRLRIPAATWNELLSMLQSWRTNPPPPRPAHRLPEINPAVMLVRNGHDAALERFHAARPVEPLILPADNTGDFKNQRAQMRVELPLAGQPFVILQTPLGVASTPEGFELATDEEFDEMTDEEFDDETTSTWSGGWGYAIAAGVSVAIVNIVSAADTHAGAADGSGVLVSSTSGAAEILWVAGEVGTATATGEQLALVRLGAGGGGGGSLPNGQYIGQQWTTTATNASAWAFDQLHSVP